MKTVESVLGLSSPAVTAANTSAAPQESLATSAPAWLIAEWNDVQDRLIDLAPSANDPIERIDDDGYILPSAQAISMVSKVAAQLRERGQAAPQTVVQDAIGGVVFEWRSGPGVARLIVNCRGEMEVVEFWNSKLVFRKPASLMRI